MRDARAEKLRASLEREVAKNFGHVDPEFYYDDLRVTVDGEVDLGKVVDDLFDDLPAASKTRLADICEAVGKNLEGRTAAQIAMHLYKIATTGALAEFALGPLPAEPHEVAEEIAKALDPHWKTYDPEGPIRTKGQALAWAAHVARGMYPKPEAEK